MFSEQEITMNLTLLTKKEKIYLTELARFLLDSRFEITDSTLNCVKPGVLQLALQQQSSRLHKRKIKVLEKILQKIIYPQVLEGELSIPAENILVESSEKV